MTGRKHIKKNIVALCLLLAMLSQLLGSIPVHAAEQTLAYPVQSAEYRSQFLTDFWNADGGELKQNNTQGITFHISERNAALYADVLAYAGDTANNALQLVVENRTACTAVQIEYTYTDMSAQEQVGIYTLKIAPQSDKIVYYAYFDEIDAIRSLRLVFEGVKSGEVIVYGVARASYYYRLEKTHGSVTSCEYDPNLQTVTVQGTVRTDAVADFSGGSILLYQLQSFETLQQLFARRAQPLHTINMTNRFTFSVDTPLFSEANARYAVALRDRHGNIVPMTEPVIAVHRSIAQASLQGSRTVQHFKGVYTPDTAAAQRIFAGNAVVDVYLNRLFTSESNGKAFSFDGTYYSFDREYTDELLKQTLPLLATGIEVTLRLLIEPDASGYALPFASSLSVKTTSTEPTYLGIYLSSAEAQRAYGAVLSYIFSEYVSGGVGLPSGIVPGVKTNRLSCNDVGSVPFYDYLRNVALLLALTKNISAQYDPLVYVYLSVDDEEYPLWYDTQMTNGGCSAQLLLEGVCRILDDFGCADASFHLMLEKGSAPFGLNAEILENGVEGVQAAMYYENSTGATKNIPTVERLLSTLSEYSCIAPTGAVMWTPAEDCTGLALSLSYTYLYHLYFGNRMIDSFVVQLNNADAEAVLGKLIAGIDTNTAVELTSFALPYFELSGWNLLAGPGTQRRTVYECTLDEINRQTFAGSYEYWNFTSALSTLGWNGGFGCNSLSTDGGSRFGRVLLAELSGQTGGALTYTFSSPEKFSVCDALSLTLAVTDKSGKPVPAKVTVTLLGESFRMEGSAVLDSGEMETLALTSRLLKSTGGCHSVLLTVVPISAKDEAIRLHVMQIEGWSRDKDADALQAAVHASHENDRLPEGTDTASRRMLTLVVFAAILITAAGFFAIAKNQRKKQL